MKENEEAQAMTVGRILSDARLRRGESVSDVEKATKIRARFILAIEENNYGAIAGDVYARGFIRTYASHLGLDPQPLIEQYIQEYDHPLKFDSKIRPREEPRRSEGWGRRFSTTLSIVACMLLLLYWGATASRKTIDREIKSAMNAKTPTSQPNAGMKPPTTPQTTIKPSGVNITLTAVDDEGCWLSVLVDGQPTFEGILQKNQTQELKGTQEVIVTIGNAGGISIKRDGKDLGKIGERGAVVERTFKVGE
ncbi:MAG: helix-turn-helix domain-containing protein [Candidatus Aquicultorales bacterium]